MSALAPHSDRFWQDYKTIVSRLLSPLAAGDGVPLEEIAMAERRPRLTLPGLLRDFYRLTARRADINASHDRLLELEELSFDENRLVFYVENQDVCVWGIEAHRLAGDDPPVWRGTSVYKEERLVWELDHDRLSGFLIAMLFSQAALGGMPYCGVARGGTDPPAGAPGWESRDLGGDWECRVLLRDGQLLFISGASGDVDIYGGGRTRDDFLALTKTFGLEWDWSTLDEEENEPNT